MKKILLFALLSVCCIPLFSCSRAKTVLNKTEEHKLQDIYRSSTVIAYAKCTGVSEQNGYASFETKKVLYGTVGDTFFFESSDMNVDSEYLFFLDTTNNKTQFNENIGVYMRRDGDVLCLNESEYTVNSIESYIREYSAVITMPAHTYFYDTRAKLLDNCTDIIIGRLNSSSKAETKSIYQKTEATSVERMMKCNSSSVSVISTLRGDIQRGSTIEVLFGPETVYSMTDISTLSTVSLQSKDIADLENGKYYIFFLNASLDPKQEYYFPVNPIQGWIYLNKDLLSAAEQNKLFEDCTQLKALVGELNSVSQQATALRNDNTSPDGQ